MLKLKIARGLVSIDTESMCYRFIPGYVSVNTEAGPKKLRAAAFEISDKNMSCTLVAVGKLAQATLHGLIIRAAKTRACSDDVEIAHVYYIQEMKFVSLDYKEKFSIMGIEPGDELQ